MFARDLAGIDGRRPRGVRRRRGRPDRVELECSLVGHEGAIDYAPGTLMQRIMGADRSVERYHCSYGLDPAYLAC